MLLKFDHYRVTVSTATATKGSQYLQLRLNETLSEDEQKRIKETLAKCVNAYTSKYPPQSTGYSVSLSYPEDKLIRFEINSPQRENLSSFLNDILLAEAFSEIFKEPMSNYYGGGLAMFLEGATKLEEIPQVPNLIFQGCSFQGPYFLLDKLYFRLWNHDASPHNPSIWNHNESPHERLLDALSKALARFKVYSNTHGLDSVQFQLTAERQLTLSVGKEFDGTLLFYLMGSRELQNCFIAFATSWKPLPKEGEEEREEKSRVDDRVSARALPSSNFIAKNNAEREKLEMKKDGKEADKSMHSPQTTEPKKYNPIWNFCCC